jgi:anti-anti-sigma factor
MSVQQGSQEPIFLELLPEPQSVVQLQTLVQRVRECGAANVILDFKRVGIFTSASLAELIRLQKLLSDSRHELTLRHVGPATKGIFSVTGLDEILTIVGEKLDEGATLPQSK